MVPRSYLQAAASIVLSTSLKSFVYSLLLHVHKEVLRHLRIDMSFTHIPTLPSGASLRTSYTTIVTSEQLEDEDTWIAGRIVWMIYVLSCGRNWIFIVGGNNIAGGIELFLPEETVLQEELICLCQRKLYCRRNWFGWGYLLKALESKPSSYNLRFEAHTPNRCNLGTPIGGQFTR